MSERFDRMAAERDALYQATLPVKGSKMAMALWLDRKAERSTKEAGYARRMRAFVLSLLKAPDNGH